MLFYLIFENFGRPDCAIYVLMYMNYLQARRELEWGLADARKYRARVATSLLLDDKSMLMNLAS